MTMAYTPKITRHADNRDVPMVLVERTELDALRSALRGMLGLLEVQQYAGRKYLDPGYEECDCDWYVSRMLWLTDGPAQRQFEQAARDALLTANAHADLPAVAGKVRRVVGLSDSEGGRE